MRSTLAAMAVLCLVPLGSANGSGNFYCQHLTGMTEEDAALRPQLCGICRAFVPQACKPIWKAYESGSGCNPSSGGRNKRSSVGCGVSCTSISYCTHKMNL